MEGLLPKDRRLDRIFRHVTLESGLAIGFTLLALSAAASLYARRLLEVDSLRPVKSGNAC